MLIKTMSELLKRKKKNKVKIHILNLVFILFPKNNIDAF